MLAKRRLFGALLFMLTLLSSAACAKLNLKPYEVPSASGTEVEILAPEVYLLLHDSPLNGGKLKTALVLLDHGQTVFEQRLPEIIQPTAKTSAIGSLLRMQTDTAF